MRESGSSELIEAEKLLLEHFKFQPFHNLHMIYGEKLLSKPPGGTCSDKTLSFIADARQQGLDVALHSALIDGQEIHRLASVKIGQQQYFVDIGNGWPSLKLYPVDRPINYRCFGMRFRTEVDEKNVTVFHEKNGSETLQMEIPFTSRSETEILTAIEQRFTSGIVYPFSKKLRFSMIVGDRFLFLRDDRVEFYGDAGFEGVSELKAMPISQLLLNYFNVEIEFASGTLLKG